MYRTYPNPCEAVVHNVFASFLSGRGASAYVSMSSSTHLFDHYLNKHGALRSPSRMMRTSVTDEFLKEAYRIVSSHSDTPISCIR